VALRYRMWYSSMHDHQNFLESRRALKEGRYKKLTHRRKLGRVDGVGTVRYTAKFLYELDLHGQWGSRESEARDVAIREGGYRQRWPDAVFVGEGEAPDGMNQREPYPSPWTAWSLPKPEPTVSPPDEEAPAQEAPAKRRRFRLDLSED
jgi:hypothetical protein